MWLLVSTEGDRWSPGIGDPTFMGWFTVAAYWFAAWLCHRAYRRTRSAGPMSKAARLWWWLALALGLLGVNKQLDLQSLFTQIGRDMARSEGWYGRRQIVQFDFIIALALAGAAAIAAMFWIMRDSLRSCGVSLMGTVFIITFVVIRAASFHHFDEFLGWDFLGFEMNWILELGGIACVAAGAWPIALGRPARRARGTPPGMGEANS